MNVHIMASGHGKQ